MNDETKQCCAKDELERIRKEHSLAIKDIDSRLANDEAVMLKFHNRVNEMGEAVKELDSFVELRTEVYELLDILKNLKGFFIVLSWIGKIAKWVAVIVTAGSLFVAALKRILEI